MTLTKEEMQKQIEAVRGLIVGWNNIYHDMTARGDEYSEVTAQSIEYIEHGLRTLTETLKPFLGDDKLEV